MITKKVNRYYCEYCKKSGCAAGHIKKHERHCTMNPDRICRMCAAMGNTQVNLQEVIKLLPKETDFIEKTKILDVDEIYTNFEKCSEACLEIIEKHTECPACILAVFRQAGIHPSTFDFKKRCEEWWKVINKRSADYDYGRIYAVY